MVDVAILLAIAALGVVLGLWIWRRLRGPVSRRRGLARRGLVLAVVIVPLVMFEGWRFSKARELQVFGGIVTSVATDQPAVALTFDDGPTGYTDEVLAILTEYDVPATFFLVGQAIAADPDACQRIAAAGHELGNHSYSHQQMIFQPLEFIQEEIEQTDRLIRECGYTGDIHFRSPFGKKLFLLPYYLSRTGRLNILWDIEPESYEAIAVDGDRIAADVLARAHPGAIILLHVLPDVREESRRALPVLIEGLQAAGYQFVTVSDLLAMN